MPKMNVKKGDKVVVLSPKPNAQNQQGGIIEKEAAIDASNVMLICPSCGKPTRVGHKSGELNGKKTAIRVCKKCGAEF